MNIEKLAIVISGVDSTSNLFDKVTKNIGTMGSKLKELTDSGKHWQVMGARLNQVGSMALTGGAALGAFIAPAIAKVASAQDSFNQVQNLTGKTAEEMKHFRSQIYQIASETGQASEELLAASMSKIRRGMSEADIFETLKTEGKYATATHSKNLAQISDATYVFSRQMKMTVKEASDAFAGVLHISKNGIIDFESLMGQAPALLGEASSMGVAREKGLVQVLAAAQIAAKDSSIGADGAAASVQSLFADLKTAKQDKALEAAGLGGLQEDAENSGNYIAHVVQRVMEKTQGNEVELAKIFKSASTRNLIRTMADDLEKGKDSEYEALFAKPPIN